MEDNNASRTKNDKLANDEHTKPSATMLLWNTSILKMLLVYHK